MVRDKLPLLLLGTVLTVLICANIGMAIFNRRAGSGASPVNAEQDATSHEPAPPPPADPPVPAADSPSPASTQPQERSVAKVEWTGSMSGMLHARVTNLTSYPLTNLLLQADLEMGAPERDANQDIDEDRYHVRAVRFTCQGFVTYTESYHRTMQTSFVSNGPRRPATARQTFGPFMDKTGHVMDCESRTSGMILPGASADVSITATHYDNEQYLFGRARYITETRLYHGHAAGGAEYPVYENRDYGESLAADYGESLAECAAAKRADILAGIIRPNGFNPAENRLPPDCVRDELPIVVENDRQE